MPVSLHNPTNAEADRFPSASGGATGVVAISNSIERIDIYGPPEMCREIAEVIERHTAHDAAKVTA